MTDKGSPCSITYKGKLCWASTELMNDGGKLLIGIKQDMERSRNRVKSKLATDRLGEFNGPPIEKFENCISAKKRLVCYHKLYRFFMVSDGWELEWRFHRAVFSEFKMSIQM